MQYSLTHVLRFTHSRTVVHFSVSYPRAYPMIGCPFCYSGRLTMATNKDRLSLQYGSSNCAALRLTIEQTRANVVAPRLLPIQPVPPGQCTHIVHKWARICTVKRPADICRPVAIHYLESMGAAHRRSSSTKHEVHIERFSRDSTRLGPSRLESRCCCSVISQFASLVLHTLQPLASCPSSR